jgi:hypothetical protein
MKWLKKFEELDPQTYRNAGWGLKNRGKIDRSNVLADYADEKEFGFFNLNLYKSEGLSLVQKNIPFTEPKLIGVYSGTPKSSNSSIYQRSFNPETCVNDWVSGNDDLSITFQFGFKFSEKYAKTHPMFLSHNRAQRINAFSITINLSDWAEGLVEYNDPSRWDLNPDEIEKSNAGEMFENTLTYDISLGYPWGPYCGIFSDRASANKFKKFFQKVIEEKGDVIYDVIGILNADAKIYETAVSKLKDIRVNSLYDDSNLGPKFFFGRDI